MKSYMRKNNISWRHFVKADRKKIFLTFINLLILFIISLVSSFYFYRIVLTIFPGEEALSTLAEFFKRSFGDNNGGDSETLVWSLARYAGYQLGGLSLSACSVMLSFCYFFVLFFSAYLCVSDDRSHEINWNWWLIPLFAYLMVFINPNLENFYHYYPFNFHLPSIIYALVTMIFVRMWLLNPQNRRYFTYCMICIAVSILLKADLIYLLLTVVPLIFVLLVKVWRERTKNSQLLVLSLFTISLLAVLKHISKFLGSLSYWYSESPIGYGDWLTDKNVLYGEANFGDLYSVVDRIENYGKGLLALFHADISNKPILRINTLFYFFRIIVVLIILICVFQTIINFLRGREEDLYSTYLASGFATLSLFFILFEFGNLVINYRYITAILPWGTIFLCYQLKKKKYTLIKRYVECPLLKRNFRIMAVIFFSSLCVFDFSDFYRENQYTETDREYIEVSRYLSSRDLSYGLAPYWLSFPLTIANSGDSILFSSAVNDNATGLSASYFSVAPSENYHHENCSYIVVGDGSNTDLLYDGQGAEWIGEQYETPAETVQIGGECILIYDYNVNIVPRVYNAQALQWFSYGNASSKVTLTPSHPLYCEASDLSAGIWEVRLYGTNIDSLSVSLESIDVLYTRKEQNYTAFGFKIYQGGDYSVFLTQKKGTSILDKVMIVNISDGIDLCDNLVLTDTSDGSYSLVLDDFVGTYDIIAYSPNSRELSLYMENEPVKPVAVGNDRCIWRMDINPTTSYDALYITADSREVLIDRITICSPNALEAPITDDTYWVNKDLRSLSELARFDRAFALFPGQTVFGPYITLEPGKYQLIWDAKTFGAQDVEFAVKYDYGSSSVPITSCSVLDDSVIICFEIDRRIDNIEFICTNNSGKMILISDVRARSDS